MSINLKHNFMVLTFNPKMYLIKAVLELLTAKMKSTSVKKCKHWNI